MYIPAKKKTFHARHPVSTCFWCPRPHPPPCCHAQRHHQTPSHWSTRRSAPLSPRCGATSSNTSVAKVGEAGYRAMGHQSVQGDDDAESGHGGHGSCLPPCSFFFPFCLVYLFRCSSSVLDALQFLRQNTQTTESCNMLVKTFFLQEDVVGLQYSSARTCPRESAKTLYPVASVSRDVVPHSTYTHGTTRS